MTIPILKNVGFLTLTCLTCLVSPALSQNNSPKQSPNKGNSEFPGFGGPPNGGGPGGFPGFTPGGPGGQGPGGPGGGPPGFGGNQRALLKEYDANKDGWLNLAEREKARKSNKNKQQARMPFGPFGQGGADASPTEPGRKLTSSDVKQYDDESLYDPSVLRTLFLTFENEDWEKELEDFHGSDVDVPATLVVDGKDYPNVGVHFRGLSSYMHVRAGKKRSLNVSMDLANPEQRLLGSKTLNLLNAHEDDSMMSSVLYSHIARQYIPAPNANFVQVVINGECWGVYSNVQQFDKEFLKENYGTSEGARWKVKGMPFADSGLRYLGTDVKEYKNKYTLKSSENSKAWKDLIRLCRVLQETPTNKLPATLKPILDVDSVLQFLAVDVALVNNDGYWVRASDYNLYQDTKGVFHLIPHDMNEALSGAGPKMPGGPSGPRFDGPGPGGPGFGAPGRPEGPGFGPGGPDGPGPGNFRGPGGTGGPARGGRGGGPGMMGGDVNLDPLIGLDDDRKPLRSKLLAVPEFKKKYMEYVRAIAERSMSEEYIAPVIENYRTLIDAEVKLDTRKLGSYEAFVMATSSEVSTFDPKSREMSLRTFFSERRKVLLSTR